MNTNLNHDLPAMTDVPTQTLWRRLWRLHFIAGLVVAPALLWFAFTGLVILYTEPIQQGIHGDLYRVEVPEGEYASAPDLVDLDRQHRAVEAAFPESSLWSVTPGKEPHLATRFDIEDADGVGRNVFVDPYGGEVLGDLKMDTGLIAFANRTHGSFLPREFTMPIPSLTGIFGEGPALRTVEIGEVLVEIVAGWALVLAVSGIYLWWPRSNSKKRLFIPRFRGGGRPMWRDMHATGGTVLSVGLIFFVVTGLPWATFWGNEFSTVADKITPNTSNFWSDPAPGSDVPKVGDLTRFGVVVPWAALGDPVPPSSATDDGDVDHHDDGGHHTHGGGGSTVSTVPVDPVGLEVAFQAALDENMVPGFSIMPPSDTENEDGSITYGSYVVMNPWPSSLGEQGALYLDQFTAKTLGRSDVGTWGGIQQVTELGVQTHMGTQFGLANRIFLTLVCMVVVGNIITALVMWLRRRRKGTFGVPRRVDASKSRAFGIIALILGIIYPLWGLSAIALLVVDTLVRRWRRSTTPPPELAPSSTSA